MWALELQQWCKVVHINKTSDRITGKTVDEGKVHPRTGHEGPEAE